MRHISSTPRPASHYACLALAEIDVPEMGVPELGGRRRLGGCVLPSPPSLACEASPKQRKHQGLIFPVKHSKTFIYDKEYKSFYFSPKL